jgi:type VI secretion system protein ImpA
MADALAEWATVRALTNTILSTQSKDLEVAAWYLEALLRKHGLDGFIVGTRLLQGLIGQYWADLYPVPDEDDGSEARIKPLLGIFGGESEGTLMAALRTLPVVPEGSGNDQVDTFQLWHYDAAQQANRIEAADKRSEKIARLGFGLDDIERAVAAAPDAFYHTLIESCATAVTALNELNEAILAQARQDRTLPTPKLSAVRTLIEDDYLAALRHLARDKLNRPRPAADHTAPAPSPRTAGDAAPAPTTSVAVGAIANRDQALAQLAEIARFFRLSEPHTPLAGALERVVRWGRMPLSELMLELLPGEQSRRIYSQLTGIELREGVADDSIPVVAYATSSESRPVRSDGPADTGRSANANDGW